MAYSVKTLIGSLGALELGTMGVALEQQTTFSPLTAVCFLEVFLMPRFLLYLQKAISLVLLESWLLELLRPQHLPNFGCGRVLLLEDFPWLQCEYGRMQSIKAQISQARRPFNQYPWVLSGFLRALSSGFSGKLLWLVPFLRLKEVTDGYVFEHYVLDIDGPARGIAWGGHYLRQIELGS